MNSVPWTPLGHMQTCFKTKNGTPRQPTISPNSRGLLTIDKTIFTNPDHSLEGLGDYSYVWILFAFHLNANKSVRAKVRPPRLDGAKLGVFATRSPHRPNPIGLTLAKLEHVDGASLTVSGVDIVDGTPIIDIKPYIPQYDTPRIKSCDTRTAVQSADSAGPPSDTSAHKEGCDPSLKASLWGQELLPDLDIVFTVRAEKDLASFHGRSNTATESNPTLELLTDHGALRQAIVDILKADPRSTYRRNKCSDRLYYFTLDKCHITAWFDYSTNPVTVEVVRVKPQDVMTKILTET